MEGELEAERQRRFAVVEALRNAKYTAAQRPYSGAEDQGRWCLGSEAAVA